MRIGARVTIPLKVFALIQERNELFNLPLKTLACRIRDIGFRCNRCGACCTKAVNDHIFLLDRDVDNLMTIDPVAAEPAPHPEVCDQEGILYTSGYAVRMKDGNPAICGFFDGEGCRIYDRRFSICRIYPYMLRRTILADGQVTWQYFSGKCAHGCYHSSSADECLTRAREILEYENAYLNQQISFQETVQEYFTQNALYHDPKEYACQVKRLCQGYPVTVKVYHGGKFVEQQIEKNTPSSLGGVVRPAGQLVLSCRVNL